MEKEMKQLPLDEADAQADRDKEAQAELVRNMERRLSYKTKGQTVYKDHTAPTPVYHPEYEKANGGSGYYNAELFSQLEVIDKKFEDYSVGGKPVSQDEYCGLVAAFTLLPQNGLKAYNFSKGGMTAKCYVESFAREQGFWAPDKACQAYVIAMGVNDIYNQKMPIGDKADITATEFSNGRPFISYYAEIVRRYKQISPDAKFFFVTFPNEGKSKNPATAEAMADAMYALAEHFENAYVIDLYKYGPVFDDAFREKYFLYDHMTPAGYIYFAELIDSYIDCIIRTNPADFKYAGLIGTNIPYK